MKEFRTKLSKVWQLGSKESYTVAPIISTENPTSAPPAPGVIWVNTQSPAGPAIYISSGTTSVSDWRLIWD